MNAYRARLFDDPHGWMRGTVRLHLFRPASQNHYEVLLEDGTWLEVEEAVAPPDNAGILLPREAIEQVVVAINEWQGHVSHADTEARVLREWLGVEQRRVDEALKR